MSVSLGNNFKCPKCGSSMFGTSNCTDWPEATGHCHGFKSNGHRCGFKWRRATQDKEVFTGVKT